MLKSEAAAYLAGLSSEDNSNAASPTNVHTISGEVVEDSVDGSAKVSIDGMMFSEEDDQYIEVDTVGGLKAGDVVTMLISGEDGHGMTPLAIGSVGSIDRLGDEVEQIDAYAQAAQSSAVAAANSAQEAADNAEASASSALEAQNNAETSAEAAQLAQSNAQTSAAAAQLAQSNAQTSAEAAQLAQSNASSSAQSALQAQQNAETAAQAASDSETYARGALLSLSTVEDVVDTLTWITKHGTMALTTDTTVNPSKIYFVSDASGQYVVGGNSYSIVQNPIDSELSGYYELTIDKSVENYIATHVSVTNEGLWLTPTSSNGYRVLIATGGGTTYTTAGTYIIDNVGNIRAIIGARLQLGPLSEAHMETDSTGVHIFDPNGTEVATYSNMATIGRSGETRVEVDRSSLRLIDSGNHEYAYIGDERESDGYARFYEIFTGDGSTTRFYLVGAIVNQTYELVEAYVDDDSGGSATLQGISITFESAPSSGAYIGITYKTSSRYAKTYKLGESTGNRGMLSFSEGYVTSSPGWASHAEGFQTSAAAPRAHAEGNGSKANGDSSHAEGVSTRANGEGSHAEGFNSLASGEYSHAGGVGTMTTSEGQTAIGKYNATGTHAFFIGNGTYDNRSNAFTVGWDGSLLMRDNTHTGSYRPPSNTPLHSMLNYDKSGTSVGYSQITLTSNSIYRSFAVTNLVTSKAAAIYINNYDSGTTTLAGSSGMTLERAATTVTLANSSATTNNCWRNMALATVTLGALHLSSALANDSNRNVGTVPSGYRPADTVWVTGATNADASTGKVFIAIASSGAITLYNRSGASLGTGVNMYFSTTYCI